MMMVMMVIRMRVRLIVIMGMVVIIVTTTWQNPHRKLRDIFAYKIGLRQELVYAKTWATIWNLIRFIVVVIFSFLVVIMTIIFSFLCFG